MLLHRYPDGKKASIVGKELVCTIVSAGAAGQLQRSGLFALVAQTAWP